MFIIISIINKNKDKINMYLNQEDKEDKEVILEAYQALSTECSNKSFFLKSLINELLTNKKKNKICNKQTVIDNTDIDLYLILGIQNVSSDELFKPRGHLIKLLKRQFNNEKDDNTINSRVMATIMDNMTPFLINTTSLETKCKLVSMLENHNHNDNNNNNNNYVYYNRYNYKFTDKNPYKLVEKFSETNNRETLFEDLIKLYNAAIDRFNYTLGYNTTVIKNNINKLNNDYTKENLDTLLLLEGDLTTEIAKVKSTLDILKGYVIKLDSFLNDMFTNVENGLGIPKKIIDELKKDIPDITIIDNTEEELADYKNFLSSENVIDFLEGKGKGKMDELKERTEEINTIISDVDFNANLETINSYFNSLNKPEIEPQTEEETEQETEEEEEEPKPKLELYEIIIISISGFILIIIIIFISKYIIKKRKLQTIENKSSTHNISYKEQHKKILHKDKIDKNKLNKLVVKKQQPKPQPLKKSKLKPNSNSFNNIPH